MTQRSGGSTSSSLWIFKTLRLSSATPEEAHFGHLHPQSHSFVQYSKLIGHRWRLGSWWTGKLRALSSGSAPSSPQWSVTTPTLHLMPHQTACPSHTKFPLAREEDPDIKPPHLGWQHTPTQREQATVFWEGTTLSIPALFGNLRLRYNKYFFAHNKLILWKL